MADAAAAAPDLTSSFNPSSNSTGSSNLACSAPCYLPHCAGSSSNMYNHVPPGECDECVVDCDMIFCSGDTAQCTDQCAVVSCEDPSACIEACQNCNFSHLSCRDICCVYPGDTIKSTGNSCCSGKTTSHPLTDSDEQSLLPWNSTSAPTTEHSLTEAFLQDMGALQGGLQKATLQPNTPPYIMHSNARSDEASSLLSPIPTFTESAQSSPSLTSSTLSPLLYPASDFQSDSIDQNCASTSVALCLWMGCGQQFNSIQDLSAHVNSVHLNAQLIHVQDPQRQAPEPENISDFAVAALNPPFAESLTCRWDDCGQGSSLESFDPSTIVSPDVLKEVLLQHVQQAHLGGALDDVDSASITPAHQAEPETSFEPIEPSSSASSERSVPPEGVISQAASQDDDFAPTGIQGCFCKWQSCCMGDVAFASPAELTEHITDNHVGTGYSRYHCWWDGCSRNNDLGFISKQKILRHIQSHTGHRPFQCPECNQFFSEAATLQQHMRRHTKEKPYRCDFPGCGKTFAITGALTIHKRVHSGSKPFKCSHCEKTFSESSNLSKHVRTHTGDRPYVCPHPGCGKRFPRPDQITRHKKIHTRKNKAKNQEEVDLEMAATDAAIMSN